MIRQCAWCLKIMGEIEPLEDTSITHGICMACEKKMMKEVEVMQKQAMRKAS